MIYFVVSEKLRDRKKRGREAIFRCHEDNNDGFNSHHSCASSACLLSKRIFKYVKPQNRARNPASNPRMCFSFFPSIRCHTMLCHAMPCRAMPNPIHFFSAEYGRTCKDIGCLPSETCVIAQDSCSWGQQDGKECGNFPTCKKSSTMNGNHSPGKLTFQYYIISMQNLTF